MDTQNLLAQQLMGQTWNFGTVTQGGRTNASSGSDSFDTLIRRKTDSADTKTSADTGNASEVGTDDTEAPETAEAPNAAADSGVAEDQEISAETETREPEISVDDDDSNIIFAAGLMYEPRPEIQYVDTPDSVVEVESAPEIGAVTDVHAEITAETVSPETVPEMAETAEAPVETITVEDAAPAAAKITDVKTDEPTEIIDEPTAEAADVVPERTVAVDTNGAAEDEETQLEDGGDGAEEIIQDENKDAGTPAPVFENVKATPVKVAEPTHETVSIEADDAIEQLADKLGASIEVGDNRVEITLSPANLGKLTVEITRSDSGVLSVVMHTTNAKAAAILERGTSNLQNLIAANTDSDVKVEVQKSDGTENQYLNPNDRQDAHQQQREQQKKRKPDDTADFIQKLRLGLVGLDGDVA